MSSADLNALIKQLKDTLLDFNTKFGVPDIITNSKIFEVLIADSLGHILIPGHSGSRDAKTKNGDEFEYKHFKQSSSNHSWTFNDFSDTTIKKLCVTKSVIFAHIQDENIPFPIFDYYYEVPGTVVSHYLENATQLIKNHRKMINVSPKQIEKSMGFTKIQVKKKKGGPYSIWITRIVDLISQIETLVDTKGILTSNKFWEVLVALELGHKVQSEQAKHDAIDDKGGTYEYKVAKGSCWSFQDISKEVLKKYLTNEAIILASVDKDEFRVEKIYQVETKKIVRLLEKKLKDKTGRYFIAGKSIRRLQASLSTKDIKKLGGKLIYLRESK